MSKFPNCVYLFVIALEALSNYFRGIVNPFWVTTGIGHCYIYLIACAVLLMLIWAPKSW